MNKQTIVTIERIKQFCDEFLEKKIDFDVFQTTLGAIRSNFENDIPKEIQGYVNNFVEELELIRCTRSSEKYFNLVVKEIEKLNAFLAKYERRRKVDDRD